MDKTPYISRWQSSYSWIGIQRRNNLCTMYLSPLPASQRVMYIIQLWHSYCYVFPPTAHHDEALVISSTLSQSSSVAQHHAGWQHAPAFIGRRFSFNSPRLHYQADHHQHWIHSVHVWQHLPQHLLQAGHHCGDKTSGKYCICSIINTFLCWKCFWNFPQFLTPCEALVQGPTD